MAYKIRINGTTEIVPTPAEGDDPAEIHIYDGTGRMIAAIDLFTNLVNLIAFDQDGTVAEAIPARARH